MRVTIWRIACLLIAILLILASISKLVLVKTDPYHHELFPPWFLILISMFESVLAGYVLVLGNTEAAKRLIMLIFTFFAILLLFFDIAGINDCGCAGIVKASPLGMIIIDSVIVLLCIAGKSSEFEPDMIGLTVIPATVFAIGATLLILFILPINQARFFGSLLGRGIIVEPALLDVGAGQIGTGKRFDVQLTNLTDQPITVTGANAECSCFAAAGLPVTVSPGESVSIPITIKFKGAKVFTQYQLFTNYKPNPIISARIAGKVLATD